MKIELQDGKSQEEFERLYNEDTEAGIKYATGFDVGHCAWRYAHIHEAVSKMGGWANYSHWTNKHSLSHFNALAELEEENKKLKAIVNDVVELHRKTTVMVWPRT